MGKTQAIRAAIARTADALLAVTLAPRCAACARPLDSPLNGPVCPGCWARVQLLPASLVEPVAGAVAAWQAAGEYEGALRQIVHALKYDGRRSLARPLGLMMRAAGGRLLQDADLAVPVPLHPWRRMRRGFNQAADLARHLDLPVVHALLRRRSTAPQSGLASAARRANVRGAFALSPLRLAADHASLIDDRVIVLADDVRTTGETLNECARVLIAAGAREVRGLTAARAVLVHPKADTATVPGVRL